MVYDSFMFYNELDVLDIRLNVLDPYVDKFLIIESTMNHSKGKKELLFKKNEERFKKFLPKIIHMEVPASECLGINIANNLRHNIENYQRNFVNRFLNSNAKDGDIVIVSDCDEIPHPHLLKMFIDDKILNCIKFRTKLYRYYLNVEFQEWIQGMFIKWDKSFVDYNWSFARQKKDRWNKILEMKGEKGWHFSYVGNADQVLEKVKAYRDNRRFVKAISNGGKGYLNSLITNFKYFHFKDGECTGKKVNIKEMPIYVQENIPKFAHILV